jgi:hypothetical protein
LETSSGEQLDDPEHSDYDKDYVQEYIAKFGVRKCEANALVVVPEIGRQLCRDAILEHLPDDAVERYARKRDRARKRLRQLPAEGGMTWNPINTVTASRQRANCAPLQSRLRLLQGWLQLG